MRGVPPSSTGPFRLSVRSRSSVREPRPSQGQRPPGGESSCMKVPRNAVYGGFLYWYSGHYTGPDPRINTGLYPHVYSFEDNWAEREFRVLYVGSTGQDVQRRDGQHWEVASGGWLPEDWRTSVCNGGSGRYGSFFDSPCHRGGCAVPQGCSLLTHR